VPVNFNDIQGAECICTTSTCGAGLLNAASAVQAAQKPFGIVQATSTIDPNTSVGIDGRTSFDVDGDPVTTYQWSIVNVTGATPTIADVATGTTTLQVTGNSRFTLRLRVTDDAGLIDDTDFAMVTTTPPEPPPVPPATTPIGGGGGGGGGSFDWWLLVLGLLPLALPGPRRRKAVRVRSRPAPRNSTLREVQELYGSARRSYRNRRRQHFPQ
jgi:serine protease